MVSKKSEEQEKNLPSESLNSSKPRLKLVGNLTKTSIQEWEKGTKATIFDNNNLFLRRRKKAPVWMLRYKLGKEKNWKMMCLGKYSEKDAGGLSLQKCRELYYYELLPQIKSGKNPKTEALRTKEENATQTSILFETVYEKWFSQNVKHHHWKTSIGEKKVSYCIENHVLPKIGKMSCVSITEKDLINKIFDPLISEGKYETARKILGYLSKIWRDLDFNGEVTRDITIRTRTWLGEQFKDCKVRDKQQRMPAITEWRKLGEFLCDIENYFSNEKSKASLKTYYAHILVAYTAVRIGNALGSRWDCFFNLDGRNPYWRIPQAELKVGRTDLKVPLCQQLVKHLKDYRAWCDSQGIKSEFLFPPSVKDSKLGHMTIDNLEKFYRERGFSRVMSPHGFRASFATLANKHHPNWFLPIELCLGHQVNTSVQKLYNRATEDWLIKERREIYKWWGEKLEKCIKDTHARREKEAKITEKSKPS